MDRPVLHGYWRSSSAWRVRIALAWKGIEHDVRPVHLVADGGQQHTPAYRQLNPLREVPTLVIDGHVLTQSVAIIEYLDETRPEPPLLPRSALERARARRLVEAVNSGVQPLQNLRVLQHLGSRLGLDADATGAWARHWISFGFEGLERLLRETAGTCALGDEVTIADLFLVPQVYNARRFGVDLAPYPTIVRLDAALSARPAFAAAHPDRQPDAPAPTAAPAPAPAAGPAPAPAQ